MPEGYLSTHVLDAARGCPAEGMRLTLHRIDGDDRTLLADTVTDADGRAVFEVCADQVGDAFVYLIEGGFPMSATPIFEDDRSNPKEAKATVVVC